MSAAYGRIALGLLFILAGVWAFYLGFIVRKTRHFTGAAAMVYGVVALIFLWGIAAILLFVNGTQ